MKTNEKLKMIIDNFGIIPQLKKLNEEAWELEDAIRTYEDMYFKCDCDSQYLKNEKEHIEEEMADCWVILNQIKEYYDLDEWKIGEIIDKKIDRTIERIESKYYER